MQIFPINFKINQPINYRENIMTPRTNFQRLDMISKPDEISFRANTSNGNILKKLKEITCPYTGIKMLSGSTVTALEKRIEGFKSTERILKMLSKYTDYMQITEKKMYNIFSKYAEESPNKKLTDCLQELYNESLAKLKLEEFEVLDNVDDISKELSPETALQVRAKTTRCREVILANNKEDTFKRRIFLDSLNEIKPKNDNEKTILEKMKDQALYLPTSSSSKNAFIVKYASRGEKEIAKRILRASAGTIEHIKPDSKGGENDIGNFILVSSLANSNRENMPLEKYIKRHPNIPQYCQQYVEEIMQEIYKGHLKGNETYPYKIKERLAKESNNKIQLDLSNYRYTYSEAIEKESNYYKNLKTKRKK